MVRGVSFLNGTERFWLEKPEAVPFWAGGADSFGVMELKQKETSWFL